MPENFPLISGNPSIDLVNTEVVRRGVRHDLLASTSDLKDWIRTIQASGNFFGIVLDTKSCSDALHSVMELRTFLRSGFEKIAVQQAVDDDWQLYLEEITRRAPFSFRIVHGKLTPIPWGPHAQTLPSLIALDALQLLASKAVFKLRHCANPDCVLLFLDESGRRKWCSMKLCGNRTKVARHQSLRGKSDIK